MKAYQVIEFGAPIEPRILEDPVPTGREVVVNVSSCGLCHSDAHFHKGHLSLGGDAKLPASMLGIELPATFGHEIHGHISAFGPESGLTEKDLGRPVIVYPWIGCGHCDACLAERDNECPTPRCIGMQLPGGHGEKVVVRDAKYLIDAEGVDPGIAGIYACCGLTAYAALAKVLRRDGWTAIIGMGGVGLMTLAIAKGTGFGKVVAIDIDAAKLALATNEYGADLAVDSREEDVAERLKKETGGVIAVVGSDKTAALALSILRNGGTYVSVGLFGGTLNVPLAVLNSRQISLRGSYVGTPQELRDLVRHVRSGAIKPIPVKHAPISSINDGLAALREGKVTGRIVHMHATVEP
jgi:D-arabinose 1-dehydrogenase-like Zn-dependent alcohol dehydrogenase